MSSPNEIRVWDPLVRIFHWTLVAAFTIAYFTDEDLLSPHVWAGYAVTGLLLFRVIWGFAGTAHARFSDFVYAPAVVISFLQDTLQRKAKRYLGHNPAGGWMVVLLLIMLALISITGLALYGADKHAGPLAGVMAGTGKAVKDILEVFHEFFADLTAFLVVLHVAGVVMESILNKENLARAMVTGYKRAEAAGMKASAAKIALLMVGAGIVALGTMSGAGVARADSIENPNAKGAGTLQPLEKMIDKAEAQHMGRMIEAELKSVNGQDVYEIEILDEAGKVWEMYFDAKTGELLKHGEERDSEDIGH